MTKRIEDDVTYDPQTFDVQNRLVSVTRMGAGVTTFTYDAAGIRVKTELPNGSIIYTPFPHYEEELRLLPPTVSLAANGQSALSIPPNTSFTLAWSSSGAQSCTASGAPQWSGSKPTSGSQLMTVLQLFGSQTYTLTCSNSSGSTSRSVIVIIGEAPPPCEGFFCTESLGNGATGLNAPEGGGPTQLMQRSAYQVAGQAIATRVSGDPVNNGLTYFYNDHLGSLSALRNPSGGRSASIYYLPFGNYRGAAPTQTVTDRDFTGQPQNRAVGLLYYQARFYVPVNGFLLFRGYFPGRLA